MAPETAMAAVYKGTQRTAYDSDARSFAAERVADGCWVQFFTDDRLPEFN